VVPNSCAVYILEVCFTFVKNKSCDAFTTAVKMQKYPVITSPEFLNSRKQNQHFFPHGKSIFIR